MHYCKPRIEHMEGWDSMTCASANGLSSYTDKGVFSPTVTNGYPPRADLATGNGADSPSVAMYKMLDPFDAVSQATPPGGVATQITWHMPPGLPVGNYVLWIEVAQEVLTDDVDGDSNATYNATTYPAPVDIEFSSYGIPYRGQPSIVYSAPFAFTTGSTTAVATDYIGYGDPNDGGSGAINPPDATITTAASRLQLVSDGSDTYRVRVRAQNQNDSTPPGAVTEIAAVKEAATSANLSFVAPATTASGGKVAAYQIRYLAYATISDANFGSATEVAATVTPDDPGQVQTFEIDGLLPETQYSVGVRAIDDCGNLGPLAVTGFTTTAIRFGDVDACFIATAAYGSVMANDVDSLRGFRDRVLESSALGELAVESYYTFGPAAGAGRRQLGSAARECARGARPGGRARTLVEATMIRKSLWAAVILSVAAGFGARANAEPGVCHFVDIDFTPTADLQIVAWIVDTQGNYVDTAYITQAVGTYGLGNRPGRFDFNSGPLWPYGRRVTTFPVWSHAHGMTFPEVDFQDGQDSDLSHGFDQSSHEQHFCRPLLPSEFGSDADATTCATTAYTDKGIFSTGSNTSHYPPRVDLTPQSGVDSDSVSMYPKMNPFDGVSQATPPGGTPATLTWSTPPTVANGNYVLWVEVSKEADMDPTYNASSYPSPSDISYSEYGEPYRGQPSVVYTRAVHDRRRPTPKRRRPTTRAMAIPMARTATSACPTRRSSTTVPGSGDAPCGSS